MEGSQRESLNTTEIKGLCRMFMLKPLNQLIMFEGYASDAFNLIYVPSTMIFIAPSC